MINKKLLMSLVLGVTLNIPSVPLLKSMLDI